MGVVTVLTLLFVVASLSLKYLKEKIVFHFKGNLKYRCLNYLADYIYYGDEIGVDATLSLDQPDAALLERRLKGHAYLESTLGAGENPRGDELKGKLVDCRFALAKVCMPLLKELEVVPAKRNFITHVHHRTQSNKHATNTTSDATSAGMLQVSLANKNLNANDVNADAQKLLYVGSDAVHILGVDSFYAPLQREINRRMSLDSDASESMLRFVPISLTPEIETNANLILGLTGMDQVRYSLSGSEAMDAALKDIKSSCRGKDIIVRFSSAYHGHVSGVDVLNCGPTHLFLKECDPASLAFIEEYHYRIAAVVVNPMQHFTGINKPSPPGEKLNMGARVRTPMTRDEYARWLHSLQQKCNYCSEYLTQVALVMDDIYFAFRTPELFSTHYFTHPDTEAPLRPDVLVLGKGVAAGYPLSMVLGRKGFLNTYDKKYLLQVNKTVGTLSAWHGGIVASNVFLQAIQKPSTQQQLTTMVSKFNDFSIMLNQKFVTKELPLRIKNFANTFTIDYLSASLYNSRYPQYLMAEGIFLGNYSTGKFNLNNDATQDDLQTLADKFVTAALRMQTDGYFVPMSKGTKKKMMFRLAGRFLFNILRVYYDRMMEDKRIDIEVSHNHPVNKCGHFWSSVFMILMAYPYIFKGMPIHAGLWFFGTHVVRQSGHFFYEKQDRNIEKRKFGHKDASKKAAAAGLFLAGLVYYYRATLMTYVTQYNIGLDLSAEQYVSIITLLTIIPHFVEICYQFGMLRGLEWMIKIITDPFTDVVDFYSYWIIDPRYFLDFKDQKAIYQLDPTTKKVCKVE